MSANQAIPVEYKDKIAIITLNKPQKLNALNHDDYYHLATVMREIARKDEILATLLIGTGRFFSAYIKLIACTAKEALLFSRRISIEELKQTGFVNRVFDTPGEHQFKRRVLEAVHSYLGDHLNDSSALEIKKLLREPGDREFNTQAVKEFFGGLRRFAEGIPQAEFQKIASGAKKHKL
ncbi:hypothetical protein APSETT444_001161 [Aspergillus pseudonomiae]